MLGAGIFPGDIVLVDKAKRPRDGSLIVACFSGEFTPKRLVIDSRCGIVLHAENPRYGDIRFHGLEELTVFGVVTAVVRKL